MRRVSMVPGRLQMAFELVVGGLYSFCQSVAGEEKGRRFFPVVSTIFLFVMFNAWLGLLPGFGSIIVHSHGHVIHLLRPANTDINTPAALALVSFVFVLFFGLKDLGPKYLLQYFNVVPMFKSMGQIFTGKVKAGLGGLLTAFIMLFVSVLELLSMFIRIVSFTFRLFGNMTAGEILLLMVVFLVPYVFGVIFYGLELLVGFVQALIFAGLTLVFLTLATTAHSDESH
jgi:F-type H+-transporting ATPase subunit a